MNLQSESEVSEVTLHFLPIETVYILICHGQNAPPWLVAIGQPWVLNVEDAVDELEVVGDLLIAFNVEALRRLSDGCLEVRHGQCKIVVW